MARGDRTQRILPDFRDPTKAEGVTSEIMTRGSGRPSYKIDPDVWKTMSRKAKREFTYSNNIKFDLPPGEPIQRPINPGNPNHPDYNPYSCASVLRRNLKAGGVAGKAAKQRPIEFNLVPASRQAAFAGTRSAMPVPSQAIVAATRSAVSLPGQAHVISSRSPSRLPGGAKKQLLDLLQSIRGDNNHVSHSTSASNQNNFQANVAGTEPSMAAPTNSTVSASNQPNVAGTESAACAPTEPVASSTADETALGDAAWDPCLFPGWVGHPDFHTHPVEYPCIFWSCAVKSTTPAELIAHILLSHH